MADEAHVFTSERGGPLGADMVARMSLSPHDIWTEYR